MNKISLKNDLIQVYNFSNLTKINEKMKLENNESTILTEKILQTI